MSHERDQSLGKGVWARLAYPQSLGRHPVLKELRRLETEQWLSSDEIAARHDSRLVEIICHAASHVPFYRTRLGELGLTGENLCLPEDVSHIPILTRQQLQESRDELVAGHERPAGSVWNQSSGTTGEPVSFLHEEAYRTASVAAAARHDRWAGWNFGSRLALVRHGDLDPATASPGRENWATRWLRRQAELDAAAMSQKEMSLFCARLQRFQPQLLLGYTTALERLASHLEESGGRSFPAPGGVITCAETLTDGVREKLQRTFGAAVFDRYSSREFGLMASQCEAGRYHINTRGVHIEILDGPRPALPGTVGRVVVSGLASRAMPLLRYETGDVAELPAEDSCPCGRGLPLLGRIHGRVSDFIATPDGRLVNGEIFSRLFGECESVLDFSVVQDSTGSLTVSIVGAGEGLEHQVGAALRALRDRLGESMEMRTRRVDRIQQPSGRHRRVHSETASGRWGSGAGPGRSV